MSRYSDYDDYEGEPEQVLAQGRWEHNARVALKGKRGRKALRELREALMALPEHRLVEGAVCTVGAGSRRSAHADEATRDWQAWPGSYRPAEPFMDQVEELDRLTKRDGEGVCAVGAIAWYRKVKAGMDPAEAFASLPDLADEGSDALSETAHLGEEAGLTYTLAWELAYRNDETFSRKTPEERWTAFVEWIDRELGETVSARCPAQARARGSLPGSTVSAMSAGAGSTRATPSVRMVRAASFVSPAARTWMTTASARCITDARPVHL